jgi:hypothetical protein
MEPEERPRPVEFRPVVVPLPTHGVLRFLTLALITGVVLIVLALMTAIFIGLVQGALGF